ncbi:hypothetical protein K491DRAFT_693980 [Lophiostoma macrostomum CBS 122681]|uniref:Protein kinase domain-containing protein n=1 Tax=Lophiostoma macrostomum CBS 122681 TaxID=1314788 RepID=A0A6A6T584_9PLEO|nr:hypothetical protein K491DRAFT_693980 [Lophiostoma macrostomum CBS 122681]
MTLEVTSCVRVGADVGAQLVSVNGNMLAKIYDPLYYNGYSYHCPEFRTDTINSAEIHFERGVAAYTELQRSEAARKLIPGYHGSWTLQIATPVGKIDRQIVHYRQVRMILMEYCRGKCMASIKPRTLTRKVRSAILVKVLEADAVLKHAGVEQNDLYPRNIMLIGTDYLTPSLEVKVVDFGNASIDRLSEYYQLHKKLQARWPGKMESPILKQWDESLDAFNGCSEPS